MKLAALGAALALFAAAPRAHATRLADTPCKGCLASVPTTADAGPTPLLVLLHGDSGHAPKQLVDAWERATAARGIALLALACPRELGCEGSFWRWNGDPAWLGAQVRALDARVPIDPRRVWLLGWSGGASYLGYRLPELGEGFAAVVFHGGGIPPASSTCAARPLPSYFLVGDKNPLHGLAVRLRDEATRCAHDVTWDLLPGADHAGEWNARATHAAATLAWLEAHPAPAPHPAPTPEPAPRPAPTPAGGHTYVP